MPDSIASIAGAWIALADKTRKLTGRPQPGSIDPTGRFFVKNVLVAKLLGAVYDGGGHPDPIALSKLVDCVSPELTSADTAMRILRDWEAEGFVNIEKVGRGQKACLTTKGIGAGEGLLDLSRQALYEAGIYKEAIVFPQPTHYALLWFTPELVYFDAHRTEILGYEPPEVIGQPIGFLSPDKKAAHECVRGLIAMADAGERAVVQHLCRRRDGELVSCEIHLRAELDVERGIVYRAEDYLKTIT